MTPSAKAAVRRSPKAEDVPAAHTSGRGMLQGLHARWPCLLLCCCAVLLLCAPAPAQQPQVPAAASPDGVPLFYADFGWNGAVPGDHWGPVTVWVTGGEEAFAGSITAEYQQDATQTARTAVPFATTPGKTTPVRFILPLPNFCPKVAFTLHDESGRPLRTLTYSTAPTDTEAQLQSFIPPSEALLVTVGRTSLNEAARAWSNAADPIDLYSGRLGFSDASGSDLETSLTDARTRAAWATVRASRIEASALPLAAIAYDGLLALVVEADAASQADPRALEIVHDWVRHGGRLVIVANTPGLSWRSWLPPGPEGDLITLAPVRDGPLPAEIKSALDASAAAAAARERARREAAAEDILDAPEDAPPSEPFPAAAQRLRSRSISLTPAAASEGWALRWTDSDDPSSAALAEGPLGLGWVVVLGLDPQHTADVLSARASAAVWHDALATAASDWIRARTSGTSRQWWGRNLYSNTRADALIAALTSLADVPMTSDTLFIAIAGAMAVLALFVGPGDYFILRRMRAHQRSWLTALLWIGLASLAAFAAPRMLRSGPTQIHRVTTTDRLVRPGDAPASPAAQTGVTGIFAAEAGRLAFTQLDRASWWRGVSAGDLNTARATALVRTEQAPGSDEHGNPIDELGLGLWTFRTFMDHARPLTPLAARLRPAPTGEGWRLTVAGIPQGARIDSAVVRLGDDWIALSPADPASIADGRWETSCSIPSEPTVPPPEWLPSVPPDVYSAWSASEPAVIPELAPGNALALAGPDRRTLAIDRRVATGRWACVQLHLKDLPPDFAVDRTAVFKRTAVVRLVVPVDGAPAAQESLP